MFLGIADDCDILLVLLEGCYFQRVQFIMLEFKDYSTRESASSEQNRDQCILSKCRSPLYNICYMQVVELYYTLLSFFTDHESRLFF